MQRHQPGSTRVRSSAASDVYKGTVPALTAHGIACPIYRRWHVPLSLPRAHRQWLEALRGWHMSFPRLWVTHVQYVMKPVAISSRSARFSASRGGFAREHLLVVALSAVRGATQRHQESRRTSPRPATRPALMGSYLQYIRWSVGDVVTARTPRGSVKLSRVAAAATLFRVPRSARIPGD